MVTITQVSYFLAAVQVGSLTHAAEQLGIAQPTLSEQVRKLERELGVPVFTRAKQGLTLTEAGERFLPHARRLARDYEAALGSVASIRDRRGGTVAFGMFNSAQYVMPGLVPDFRTRFPEINLRIVGTNSVQIADDVRAGRLEAGLVALPVDARGLTIGDVLWSCEVAYFHIDRAATATPATMESVRQRPLVLPDSGFSQTDPTRRQLAERAQKQGMSMEPEIEVETGVAALAIAASGVAGAIATVPVARALGYMKQLHHVSLDPPLIETFAIVMRDPTSLSPGVEAMVELVQQHMRMLHDEHEPAPAETG